MNEQELRLKCLEMAIGGRYDKRENVVPRAHAYAEFILCGAVLEIPESKANTSANSDENLAPSFQNP